MSAVFAALLWLVVCLLMAGLLVWSCTPTP